MGGRGKKDNISVKHNNINTYNLHHLFDPINIEITSKILKMNCFSEPKKRFNWDFINDAGIINLLRIEYLRTTKIEVVFNLYQSTRLDGYSHRYENIFVTTLLTIAGTVVAGIILSIYDRSKDKIINWIKYKNNFTKDTSSAKVKTIIKQVIDRSLSYDSLSKYFSEQTNKLFNDFKILTKCYIARMMHDEYIITKKEYDVLIKYFLKNKEAKTLTICLDKFNKYESNYYQKDGSIIPEKVMLAIDGYSKGIVKNYLDNAGIEYNIKPESALTKCYYGIGASHGFGEGVAWVFGGEKANEHENYILLIDSNKFDPDEIDKIIQSIGVITINCGMTGHLPVGCRSLSKACVILTKEDFKKIKNGEHIAISGRQGLVAVGNLILAEPNDLRKK
jgi:phosphohistidine swiveling domain-containing protein